MVLAHSQRSFLPFHDTGSQTLFFPRHLGGNRYRYSKWFLSPKHIFLGVNSLLSVGTIAGVRSFQPSLCHSSGSRSLSNKLNPILRVDKQSRQSTSFSLLGLGLAQDKMPSDDSSIAAALSAQDPLVRSLLRSDVEHGVLQPLKTNLELRDDFATGNILITRVPTKAVATTIE